MLLNYTCTLQIFCSNWCFLLFVILILFDFIKGYERHQFKTTCASVNSTAVFSPVNISACASRCSAISCSGFYYQPRYSKCGLCTYALPAKADSSSILYSKIINGKIFYDNEGLLWPLSLKLWLDIFRVLPYTFSKHTFLSNTHWTTIYFRI